MTFDLTRHDLTRLAAGAGLTIIGVTSAEPFYEVARFMSEHISRGHTRGMSWFTSERAQQSCDPATLHPNARSIVSVAVPYWTGVAKPPEDGVLRGRIARYAWGRDYHVVLRRRMNQLVECLEHALGRQLTTRKLVDTARIVDRAVAARAGVGWIGKNSMVLIPGHGSWTMLGEVILDLDLPIDVPLARDCGRCMICLDRCPTGAIVEPYRIDAPRCISYLTIEEHGVIPPELRSRMGNWVFGCDVCQDVCPYTAAARPTEDIAFLPRTVDNAFPSLPWLSTMSESEFRTTFSGTAVTRAKRAGMARNAAIALGNSGDPRAESILRTMLLTHDEPLVRGHAAWAIAQLEGTQARPVLHEAHRGETSDYVRSEIEMTLAA